MRMRRGHRRQLALFRRVALWFGATGVLWCANGASAARRTASWVHDTTVQPERGVEIEQWITDEIEGEDSRTGIWWAPVMGITDNIELALPLEIVHEKSSDQTLFETYGMDLRWRLVTSDPVQVGPFVPLIRVGATRLIQDDAAKLDGSFVLSVDATKRLHLLAEAGAWMVTPGAVVEGSYGLAANYAVFEDLRLGAEGIAEQEIDNPDGTHEIWVAAGPTLSITHGRFWATLGAPIGLTRAGPDALPRLAWGIAF